MYFISAIYPSFVDTVFMFLFLLQRFQGFCRSQCDSSSLNRLKLCIAVNFFTALQEHLPTNNSSFGCTKEDSGISISDAEEEKVESKVSIPLAMDESDEIEPTKRPRLAEPEPAFEVPDEDESMALEESVENIMKEVAASKPERVKIYGFSKSIR